MNPTLDGRSLLSHRPDAKCHVLWTLADGTFRWDGDHRIHPTQADAYDGRNLDPTQAPDHEPNPSPA